MWGHLLVGVWEWVWVVKRKVLCSWVEIYVRVMYADGYGWMGMVMFEYGYVYVWMNWCLFMNIRELIDVITGIDGLWICMTKDFRYEYMGPICI